MAKILPYDISQMDVFTNTQGKQIRRDDVDHIFAGEPQEEGMMQQNKSFPWLQNQGYRTSRTLRRLARCQRRQRKSC